MRTTIIAITLLLASPVAAKVTFPVSVPFECVELAQREHVPLIINSRYEALKAKYKLYRLSRNDPLVQQCKEAVERARQAERLQAAQRQPAKQPAEQQSRLP
jgi:hypothetical protein